jgi:hypothetical protein
MINFFKSYKINLIGINKLLSLDVDPQYSYIRPMDTISTDASFIKYDYIKPYTNFKNNVTIKKSETLGFLEKYKFNRKEETSIECDVTVVQ